MCFDGGLVSREVVTGLSLWRPVFESGPKSVGFVVDKVSLEQIFLLASTPAQQHCFMLPVEAFEIKFLLTLSLPFPSIPCKLKENLTSLSLSEVLCQNYDNFVSDRYGDVF